MDKRYVVYKRKTLPFIGIFHELRKDALECMKKNSLLEGDVITFQVMGRELMQVNHPDIVKHVLMTNHKNYYKSQSNIRFETVLGKGLFTSNGEKWRRDRQKIQPMFKREQIEGYYFEVVNSVSEKYKKRWLSLANTKNEEINLAEEMSALTTEIVLKIIFGKDNLDETAVKTLYKSYNYLLDHLKYQRILPKVDFHKIFRTRAHRLFKEEMTQVETILERVSEQYKTGASSDKYNFVALLLEAQKEYPEYFSKQDIVDQAMSMVLAGFETTSLLLQWMWYALDSHPDIRQKLRAEITQHAPVALQTDSSALTYEAVSKMHYLLAAFREAMRMYPPAWATTRMPIEDDYIGDLKLERNCTIVLPQFIMHRHPRWWKEPDSFIPERFLPENENSIDPGLYFPFSQGPRKCIGYRLAEVEVCVIFAKLLPFFDVTLFNAKDNGFDPGITLKFKHPLRASIRRAPIPEQLPKAV